MAASVPDVPAPRPTALPDRAAPGPSAVPETAAPAPGAVPDRLGARPLEPARPRQVDAVGRARVDRRTKRLLERVQPGDVAVVDHRDLDRMAAAGLVARERCASDGRGVFARITPAGWQALETATPVHVAGVRRHFVDALEREELDLLARALEKVATEPPALGLVPASEFVAAAEGVG